VVRSLLSALDRCEWSVSWCLPLCAGEESKLEARCATHSVRVLFMTSQQCVTVKNILA
jgi:hypothetical protein